MNDLRPRLWRLRTKELSLDQRPLVMGILNVTPDSFSDGGKFFTAQHAIDQALRMEDDGADVIDIGGESTRPYATPVDAETERQRIAPVFEALASRVSIPLSIDTSKAIVAQAAIERGAEIVNDITGLLGDPAMLGLIAASEVGVCAMHIQGTPQTMQDNPTYENVVEEVFAHLRACDQRMIDGGVDPQRICLDPGIGFGKTHEHNIDLVRHVARFHDLGRPLLVGHSRKGFIAKLLGDKSIDRAAGTLGVSIALALSGVQFLRVHDVALTRQALTTFLAVRN
jgi:dihydropteroate synthase